MDGQSHADEPVLIGHAIGADDIDNPHNWPIHRRLYASAVALAFAFVV